MLIRTMNKIGISIVIGSVIFIALAGITQFFFSRPAVSPSLPTQESSFPLTNGIPITSENPKASDTPSSNRPVSHPLSLANEDIVSSWDFQGVYAGNAELVTKAEDEIKRLTDLLGKGEYSDTALYVSIANQYGLLGKGEREYDYLGRAIWADNETTGLPWHNLGVLMERLGAYRTARIAYEKATFVQPGLKSWHYAYLEFLTLRMKESAIIIEEAFSAATRNIGQTSYLLELHAEWKKS